MKRLKTLFMSVLVVIIPMKYIPGWKNKENRKIRSDVNSKLLADFINILIERIDLLISPDQTDEQIYDNVCTMMNLIEYGIKKTG